MKLILCYAILLISLSPLRSQERSSEEITHMIFMDSVVVKASRTGFSVADFIDLVRRDVSFYAAFKNLRLGSFELSTSMKFLDKEGELEASYIGHQRQILHDSCRFQITLLEETSGKFRRKKKGDSRYYTYDLYDRLFLVHDTLCGIDDNSSIVDYDLDAESGHVAELKKLVFAPGSRSNVPFIGSKTAIFSEKMIDKYDFAIRSEMFQGKVDAYVFEAKLKPDFLETKDNTGVIKELTTYFAKDGFQVLGRTYRLAQYKAVFQFDVFMDIVLQRKEDLYYPGAIHFEGFWNIPMKRKETSIFTVNIDDYGHSNQ